MNPLLISLPIVFGIISIILSLLGILLLDYRTSFPHVVMFEGIGFLIGLLAMSLGLYDRNRTKLDKPYFKHKSLLLTGITFAILGILSNFVTGTVIANRILTIENLIAKVKANQQTLATAMESYYIDHCQYPWPDFDVNGKPIIPHILTTPTAYVACQSTTTTIYVLVPDCNIVVDPFKNNGKGILGYGTFPSTAWIIISYGPDQVDGNTGIPGGTTINPFKAWTDLIDPFSQSTMRYGLGFDLEGSGLTYDPTNGLYSPGDIWRRGP